MVTNREYIISGNNVSEFQSKCYSFISQIPPGYVMSYGDVALHLKTCARAVGSAMKRNPFAPNVPCHRVIASDRRLGGFHGQWNEASEEVKRKRNILEAEGVQFDLDGRVSETCMMYTMGEKLSHHYDSQKITPKRKSNKVKVVVAKHDEKIRTKINEKQKSTTVTHASSTSTISREDLSNEIMKILRSRERGKTCRPSEAPRRLCSDWRPLMDLTREAARSLAKLGEIVVTQKGQILQPEDPYHGPIRLKLC